MNPLRAHADIVDHAADIIEDRGWCRNAYRDEATGAVCVEGAIRLACTGRLALNSTSGALLVGLGRHLKLNGDPRHPVSLRLPYWNDNLAIDAHHVTTELRKYAEDLRARADEHQQ